MTFGGRYFPKILPSLITSGGDLEIMEVINNNDFLEIVMTS